MLKSPLFGLSRGGAVRRWPRPRTARCARACARSEPELAARLDDIGRGGAAPARLLRSTPSCSAPSGGRKAFLARLGHEANDAIDEFLNLALDYETRETPSLQGFVAWLRTASAAVKRDMEMARDEVRVMTVHGAKGLEAPIVDPRRHHDPAGRARAFPAAAARLAARRSAARHARPHRLGAAQGGRCRADSRRARESDRAKREDEYRRLLYVAMTRAADRLDRLRRHRRKGDAARLLV